MKHIKPLYQPWSEEEFQADVHVRAMNYIQRWIYASLLRSAFICSTRPLLPNDDQILSVLSGCKNIKQWMENKNIILKMFTVTPDNLLENKRVLRDWNRIMEVREKMSEMGRKSAAVQRTFNARSTYPPDTFGEVSEVSKLSEVSEVSEVNSAEKNSTEEENNMASIRRRLQVEALNYFNINEKIPMGSQSDIDIKNLSASYGGENLIQAFIDWSLAVKNNPSVRYPISEFLRRAPQILKGEIMLKPSQELQDLLDKIGEVAGNDVVFNDAQRLTLKNLLEKFTPELILISFREFYGELTDFSKKFAAKDWTETCDQRCRNNQRALEKQRQDEQIAHQMESEGRQKVTAELGALQQQRQEEEKSVGGFMEDDLNAPTGGQEGSSANDLASGDTGLVYE